MALLVEVVGLFVLARSTDYIGLQYMSIRRGHVRQLSRALHVAVSDARRGPMYDDCNCHCLIGYRLVMVRLIEFRFDFDSIGLIVIEIENFRH